MATPYKFLDNYEFEDAEIFFGRDLEVELLLSDVISTRLVLLFAKTGSGKTSLINAGVRPRLEKLDYKTFFVRVEGDPTESARQVLANQNLLPSEMMGKSLEIQLENVVNDLKKPIVLFFDQFEEFFIHNLDEVRRKEFIASMGSIYRDRDSGVHLVFSFREEFFVEMGEFRTEIPTVFHNDSNLRLAWFTDKQAEDVILKPLQLEQFKTKVERSLVEKLLDDLRREPKGIEPPRLQVVCDTLWQERTAGEIRLDDYKRLGGATQIIERRLEEDIDKNLTDEQLSLFEKLLPLLQTRLGLRIEAESGQGRVYNELLKSLKHGRTLDELSETLKEDSARLQALLERLKQLHFIKQVKRHDGIYFEWTSDYLADRSDSFDKIVRTLIVERLLRSAMQRSAEKRKKLDEEIPSSDSTTEPLTESDIETLYLSHSEIEAITQTEYLIRKLSQEEAEFMFVAALEHGLHMRLWFQKAERHRVDVWEIIEKRITDDKARIEQAENTVRLLGEIGSDKAFGYLRMALHQQALASLTVYVLGETKTDAALDLYREALQQGILIDVVIDQLSVVKTAGAFDLLRRALEQDAQSEQAARALERISNSRSHPFATQARAILEDRSRNEKLRIQRSRSIEEVRRGEPETFERRRPAKREYVPPSIRQPEPQWRRDLAPHTKPLPNEDWAVLIRRIHDGKCTAFIGDSTSSHYLPSAAEIAENWANEFRYPLADSTNLNRVAQFLSVKFDSDYARQHLRETYLRSPRPDFADPFNSYTVLADLPFPIYIATTYDTFLVEALRQRKRDPKEFFLWNKNSTRQPDDGNYFRPTASNPAIFYLYGNIEEPGSMLITIDDFFQLLTSIERDRLIPAFLEAALVGTSHLLLGYRITDISFQFLYHLLTYYMRRSNRIHISVQLNPLPDQAPEEQLQFAQEYVTRYLEHTRVKVYWGTSHEFTTELRDRWESAYKNERF